MSYLAIYSLIVCPVLLAGLFFVVLSVSDVLTSDFSNYHFTGGEES